MTGVAGKWVRIGVAGAAFALLIAASGCQKRYPPKAAQVAAALDETFVAAKRIEHPYDRRAALVDVATAYAYVDPDRAVTMAQSIKGYDVQRAAFAEITRALADTDPEKALEVAQVSGGSMIRGDYSWTLWNAAEALTKRNPDRALALARRMKDDEARAHMLACIAATLAESDPVKAAKVAQSIRLKYPRDHAFLRVAGNLAKADPDRALDVARSVQEPGYRLWALGSVLETLAARDPNRAVSIAQQTADAGERAELLGNVAAGMAASAPKRSEEVLDQAVKVARSIGDVESQNSTLRGIIWVMAGADPARAIKLARDVPHASMADPIRERAREDPQSALGLMRRIEDKCWRAWALGEVAKALLKTDPERAREVAAEALKVIQSIGNRKQCAWILPDLVVVLAETHVEEALEIAMSIRETDRYC